MYTNRTRQCSVVWVEEITLPEDRELQDNSKISRGGKDDKVKRRK